MRKAGLLAHLATAHRTELTWDDCEPFLFASEIAWREMINRECESLDSILCDPGLAKEFDEIASRWAPGFDSLRYRWAALKLRKKSKDVRDEAQILNDATLSKPVVLDKSSARRVPALSGVYVVVASDEKPLYAGVASDLRSRLESTRSRWKEYSHSRSLKARFFSTSCRYETRLAYQWKLVLRHRPMLNFYDQKIA
jgi:hypothetical protein